MSTILDLLNSKYTVFVGSDAGNDVIFNDAGVSSRHCQISKVGDNNFLVVDLGSPGILQHRHADEMDGKIINVPGYPARHSLL